MAICMNKNHVPTLQAHDPPIGRMMTYRKLVGTSLAG